MEGAGGWSWEYLLLLILNILIAKLVMDKCQPTLAQTLVFAWDGDLPHYSFHQ